MRNSLSLAAPVLAGLAVGGLLFATPALHARSSALVQGMSAQDLLKRVVDNELAADKNDNSLWMYTSVMRKDGGSVKEIFAETNHGILTRRIAQDGKPLDKDQSEEQIQHIRELVSDPSEALKIDRDQADDANQAEDMLRLLPQALIATYGKHRGVLQAINIKPNPNFQPSSHEAKVFQAVRGVVWVDTKEDRLAEIDGRLSHRVDFGWGILGHLDRGGRFHVVQHEVLPGHWEIVQLLVNMRGKALFFKSISVQQNETRSDYKLLPQNITLAQAANMLIHQSPASSRASAGL
jgi:hypothetical protein